MTTQPTIALADLVEKGADADLLREMITHVVERVMAFDVENLCNASYGERAADRENSRNGLLRAAVADARRIDPGEDPQAPEGIVLPAVP